MTDPPIDFTSAAPTAGSLEVAWIHGTRSRRHDDGPKLQVHHFDEHTVILRQSKSVTYEAPFIYLLFGNERALLLDTGATTDPELFPLRTTIDRLIAEWLDRHSRERYGLVVAHTHGHGDHVTGDAQFEGRPDTTVVGREVEAVQQFFGFTEWPDQILSFDLGGRVLEVMGSPGHHRAAITIYDPWSGFLLTGDTMLPGRLYVEDFALFRSSLDRMVALAERRDVTYVMGCHVEMTKQPGRDYPLGAIYQPDERDLQMTAEQLRTIRDALPAIAGTRGVHRFDDCIVYNEPPKSDERTLMVRGLIHRHSELRKLFAQGMVDKLRASLSRG